jgi:hypothetical protein
MVRGLNPDRCEGFSCSQKKKSRPVLGPTQPRIIGYSLSFPGLKRLWREVDHSSPSGPEVENEWSYISTPPCLLCVTGTTLVCFSHRCYVFCLIFLDLITLLIRDRHIFQKPKNHLQVLGARKQLLFWGATVVEWSVKLAAVTCAAICCVLLTACGW